MIHEMSGLTRAHLYVTQINSIKFHFIGTIELIMCLKFLKTNLKLKFCKLKFWKLRIFEMNLKFENFELGFWKLNF